MRGMGPGARDAHPDSRRLPLPGTRVCGLNLSWADARGWEAPAGLAYGCAPLMGRVDRARVVLEVQAANANGGVMVTGGSHSVLLGLVVVASASRAASHVSAVRAALLRRCRRRRRARLARFACCSRAANANGGGMVTGGSHSVLLGSTALAASAH